MSTEQPKKPQSANELEINLAGTPRPASKPVAPKSATAPTTEPVPDEPIPTPHSSIAVAPGASDGDLLEAVLSTPVDQLIPWEECRLPSDGIYYGWPDGLVKVRAMTQTCEKILTTERLARSGQSIDYMFRECCHFPDGFDSTQLLLGDRTFLLYYLRGITHGNNYEFAVTCPNPECGSRHTHNYDLNILASTVVYAKPELGPEPFKIVLPFLSEQLGREFYVGIRFLRAADSQAIVTNRRAKQRTGITPGMRGLHGAQKQQPVSIDESITDNLNRIIVSAMGISDTFKIRALIGRLHSTDSATIREWLKENSPGIDHTIQMECPDCSTSYVIELPMTESFFRPTKPR